ncbi:hypothetical protein ACJX0J_031988, partial [Zea mays]
MSSLPSKPYTAQPVPISLAQEGNRKKKRKTKKPTELFDHFASMRGHLGLLSWGFSDGGKSLRGWFLGDPSTMQSEQNVLHMCQYYWDLQGKAFWTLQSFIQEKGDYR